MFVYSRDLLDDVKIEERWEKSLKIVWCRFKFVRYSAGGNRQVNELRGSSSDKQSFKSHVWIWSRSHDFDADERIILDIS